MAKFSITSSFGLLLNSIIFVPGLQKHKLPKPAPCNPAIISALLKICTCSLKCKLASIIGLKPLFDKKLLTSSSLVINLKFLEFDVESLLSM